jgi:hypothetical protein
MGYDEQHPRTPSLLEKSRVGTSQRGYLERYSSIPYIENLEKKESASL